MDTKIFPATFNDMSAVLNYKKIFGTWFWSFLKLYTRVNNVGLCRKIKEFLLVMLKRATRSL